MYRKCVSEPGKRKRKREEESISDCESSNSNFLTAFTMSQLPKEHMTKLLEIIAHERNYKKDKKSMQSIRKELCTKCATNYDCKILNHEYERQCSLYRTFLDLQARGFIFDEERKILVASDTEWNEQLQRDSTVAELKEMEISCVDQWKELFDKTYIPSKVIRVEKSTSGGQDLRIWYPRKGRDPMNKGSSGDSRGSSHSSRSSRSKSITYHPYNSQVESEDARSKSVERLLAFNLPHSTHFKVLDKLEKDKTTFLWFHLDSDERIFAWFKHITQDDSEEEREELKDWIRKWELEREFSRMVPSSLPDC